MVPRKRFESASEYYASTPEEVRIILEQIRAVIQSAVPGSIETFSYQMPAFKLGRIFIFFAAFEKHIGVYPPLRGNPELQVLIAPYRGPKGNLKFSLSEPIPYELIGKLAQALAAEGG